MLEWLKDRSVLSITGKTAVRFLNNMVTNDLSSQLYSYNYMLSPQGRFLYDFFVYKLSDEEFWIDVHSLFVDSLVEKLSLYNIRKEVEIKNISANYSILYSQLSLLPKNDNKEIVFTNQDPRFHKMGFRLLVKTSYAQNLEVSSEELYVTDKYENSIPDGISDLMFNQSLVVYFGVEELSAVSYSKGCYIGQEVVSRAKYQGTLRKKLFKIISGTKIAPMELGNNIIDLSGDKIGIFCSSHNNIGIALLEEEKYLKLDKKIAIINGSQEVEIEVPIWRRE